MSVALLSVCISGKEEENFRAVISLRMDFEFKREGEEGLMPFGPPLHPRQKREDCLCHPYCESVKRNNIRKRVVIVVIL